MKDVKSLVAARVAAGATLVKSAIVRSVTCLDLDENGRCTVILRLTKDVPAMVRVDEKLLKKMEKEVELLKATAEAEEDAEKKAQLTSEADAKEAYVNSLDEDTFVKGMSDTVFSSNFELMAILRQTPRTVFVAKLAKDEPSILEEVFIGATVNILAEDVEHDTDYASIFAEEASNVEHDSVYHTIVKSVLGDDAEDFIDEMKAEHRRLLLKKALTGASKRSRRNRDEDDDEDED